MNIPSKKIFLTFQILVFSLILFAQSGNYISLKQHIEILENKNKLTRELDIFYDRDKQTITKHYYSNPEYIMAVNALGEIKTYYPAKNEVDFKQISEMSSKKSLIYYFANNFTEHLGLADEGFSLISNAIEGQYYVTKWKAPSILSGMDMVKMVFENGLPIYSEYKGVKETILRKIYYTNYKDFNRFRLPSKIIEISYLPTGDSIVSRTVFSDVKVSSTADNSYFNFKIPENAKPLNADEKSSFSICFFILLLFISINGYAQQVNLLSDLMLIDSVAKQEITSTVKRDYIYKGRAKTFKNSNPASLLFAGSLYVYQNALSQHFSASCLYHPSCSDFGKCAVQEFGLIKGTLLTFDRLSRCNRIAATDLHFEDIDTHSHKFTDSVKTYDKGFYKKNVLDQKHEH